jgi:hypothetical protein
MAVTNTSVYASSPLVVTQSTVDGLLITHNGELPLHPHQWSGGIVPIVVMPTSSGVRLLDRIPSSVSAELIGLPDDASGVATLNPVTANPCFHTLGYSMGSVSSYLPSSSGISTIDDCGEVVIKPLHRSATVSLSASMVVDSQTITDSTSFTLHAFDEPYYFRRQNESFNMSKEFDRWDYMASVGNGIMADGENGDISLGDIAKGFVGDGSNYGDIGTQFFEKIANFVDNVCNVDRAGLSPLYSIAKKLDHPMEDFGITYPNELFRLMNTVSISQNELFGADDCWTYRIGQPSCGYIAHTNLGDQLDFYTHSVSAGDVLFFQKPSDNDYRVFHVVPNSNGDELYPLSTIQSNAFDGGASTYCFFDYVSGGSGEQIGAFIDFDSPYTTISTNIPTSAWSGDGGAIDLLFEHKLREGLMLNN